MRCSSLFPALAIIGAGKIVKHSNSLIVMASYTYTIGRSTTDTTGCTGSRCTNTYLLSQQLDITDASPCQDPNHNSIPTYTHSDDDDVAAAMFSRKHRRRTRSFVRTIRSHNLAGFVGHSETEAGGCENINADGNRDVVISLEDSYSSDGNLIVITGETASGKSLFIVRALEILTGKITSSQKLASYIQQSPRTITDTSDVSATDEDDDTFIELEACLGNPHLFAIEKILQQQIHYKHQRDGDELTVHQVNEGEPKRHHQFIFRRTLRMIPVKTNVTQRRRFKSICTINGSVVSLKDFAMITSPLFAIVDATTAINAILSKSLTNGNGSCELRRTSILDAAISKSLLWELHVAQKNYRHCRLLRLKYEKETQHEQSTLRLPNTYSDDKTIDLMSHYIDELDSFASRISKFCRSLATSECDDEKLMSMPLVRISKLLSQTKWSDNGNDSSHLPKQNAFFLQNSTSTPYSSSMYELLLEFRNDLKAVDDKHQVATQMAATLGSLLSSNSAISAVHRTRKMLTTMNFGNDDTTTGSSSSIFQQSSERLHELLNQVDQKLSACVNFLENDKEMGLLSILDRVRSFYSHVTVEYIDEIINEWNLLSRKHSVSPYLLPQCYENYISERDGTNELQYKLLPRARSDEKIAYRQYLEVYQRVTNEREQIAHNLSKTMTKFYLPRLGFTASTQFIINIRRDFNNFNTFNTSDDEYRYSSSKSVAPPLYLVDRTDFVLSRKSIHDNKLNVSATCTNGNFIHDVSSSGERARILLAIECALPGSIGIACRPALFSGTDAFELYENDESSTEIYSKILNSTVQIEAWYNYSSLTPIVTIYDEIDAHIGGRAVKAMTQLLIQQSITSEQQIMAITHNPTVAAAASTHVIIQKKNAFKVMQNELDNLSADMSRKPQILVSTVLPANAKERGPNPTDVSDNMHQQRQLVSVHVIQNDPYNERRIQELVRMVCGSSDDDSNGSQKVNPERNVEAIKFVKSLIRGTNQQTHKYNHQINEF